MSGDRLIEPPHLLQRGAEVVQRPAFTVPVAGLPADRRVFLMSGDASSNRRTSRSARPRLSSAMPSPCWSSVSRKIAAASW